MLKWIATGALTIVGATMATAQDQTRVVAVNYPLQYFAQTLLGDEAEVVFPVPEGVDPSFWRPAISDISMIQSSDLILLNGAGFATWVDRVSLPRSKTVNTTAAIEDQFIVTESITHSHGDGDEHSHEGTASYVWLNPALAIAQAEAIASAVAARGLVPEAELTARLDDLRADLLALDAQGAELSASLAGTAIIATHPRYQYFADRYDLNITSLEWEAGATPTAKELADLTDMVAATGAKIILWEAAPADAAFEMATALGLQNVVFNPLARPTQGKSFVDVMSDAMGELAQITR